MQFVAYFKLLDGTLIFVWLFKCFLIFKTVVLWKALVSLLSQDEESMLSLNACLLNISYSLLPSLASRVAVQPDSPQDADFGCWHNTLNLEYK